MKTKARYRVSAQKVPRGTREQALTGLPGEFGFNDVTQFVQAVLSAENQIAGPAKNRRSVRPGGTVLIRKRVAKLLSLGKQAVAIALELGLSLRLIDRVMANLTNPNKYMNRKKLKALEAAKAKVARLEAVVARDRNRELANLPTQYGFESTAGFVAAVRLAASATDVKRRRTIRTARAKRTRGSRTR